MNSKQRVQAVFSHDKPERVPMWCGASEEFWLKAKKYFGLDDEQLRIQFHDDFRRVYAAYVSPREELDEGLTYKTVFGVARHGMGYGQPTSHPLENAGLKQIREYNWPDPKDIDVSGVKADAVKYDKKYADIFNRPQTLTYFSTVAVNIYHEKALNHLNRGYLFSFAARA
jgi:uroporphyrinogen decarboxylase